MMLSNMYERQLMISYGIILGNKFQVNPYTSKIITLKYAVNRHKPIVSNSFPATRLTLLLPTSYSCFYFYFGECSDSRFFFMRNVTLRTNIFVCMIARSQLKMYTRNEIEISAIYRLSELLISVAQVLLKSEIDFVFDVNTPILVISSFLIFEEL